MPISEAQVPTTKTGILTQLSDWGLDNKYIDAAKGMDYGTLKVHVGGGKDAAIAAFDTAMANMSPNSGHKDAEIINKDGSGQIKEGLLAMLEGNELSESVKTQVTTLFEAAVNGVVAEKLELLEAEALAEIETRVNEQVAAITDKLDEYHNLIVAEWIEENRIAIEKGIRLEIAESFIANFKELLENHNIDIPVEKEDLFITVTEENETLKQENAKQIEENVKLNATILDLKKQAVIASVCEGLSALQVDKFKTLIETFEYDNDENFKTKLTQVKENFIAKAKTDKALNEAIKPETPKTPAKSSLLTAALLA